MNRKKDPMIELMRFLMSILVVGFHTQELYNYDVSKPFAFGALAVEFFFVLSGFFLAKSIEKTASREHISLPSETGRLMKGKIMGLLPVHLAACALMLLVILLTDGEHFLTRLWSGLPSLFLAQMVIVWRETADLIEAEWYLSTMLLVFLLYFPVGVLIRRKFQKRFLVPGVMLGLTVAALGISGLCTHFQFPWNLEQNIRGMAEIAIGVFAYELLPVFKKKDGKSLAGLELGLLVPPVLVGTLPFPAAFRPVGMVVAVVCSALALPIAFSGRGITAKSDRAYSVMTALGGLSLGIYLFHPAIVELLKVYGVASLHSSVVLIIALLGGLAVAWIYDVLSQKLAKKKA